MDKNISEAIHELGILASEAGEALRKMVLEIERIKHIKPKHKQWQQPYKYHK